MKTKCNVLSGPLFWALIDCGRHKRVGCESATIKSSGIFKIFAKTNVLR